MTIDFFFFPEFAQDVRPLGFFELQILEIENYRGQLATGECCGGGGGAYSAQQQRIPEQASAATRFNTPSLQCSGAPQCNTLFRMCLREYQSRQQQQPTAAGSAAVRMDDETTGTGGVSNYHHLNSDLHHCSFGNVTSPVLGGNSFTLGGDSAAAPDSSTSSAGNLVLPFSFSWTVSHHLFIYILNFIILPGTTSLRHMNVLSNDRLA